MRISAFNRRFSPINAASFMLLFHKNWTSEHMHILYFILIRICVVLVPVTSARSWKTNFVLPDDCYQFCCILRGRIYSRSISKRVNNWGIFNNIKCFMFSMAYGKYLDSALKVSKSKGNIKNRSVPLDLRVQIHRWKFYYPGRNTNGRDNSINPSKYRIFRNQQQVHILSVACRCEVINSRN